MSGADLDAFIKNNLGPTLTANGQSNTLIVLPESSTFNLYQTYADPCMSDSECAAFVGIDAFHGYDNSFSIQNTYDRQFWQTEVSAGPGFGTQCDAATHQCQAWPLAPSDVCDGIGGIDAGVAASADAGP
jgi:O-glycosyl hydrolase